MQRFETALKTTDYLVRGILTLIPTWTNNYPIIKLGMKLLIYSQTSTMQQFKFLNG